MKTWKKVLLGVLLVAVVGGIIAGSILKSRKGIVTVQTASAERQDVVAVVTAPGSIFPKTYADISANNTGRILELDVKEGDHVRRGQVLARLEHVQQGADVAAMEASLKTSESDTQAQQAALITAQADVKRTAALLDQAKQDWERAQSLYRDKLISRADFDSKQAAYESALAQNQLSLAKVNETRAQIHSAVTRIAGSRANLQRVSDLLAKTAFQSPLDGLVTYLPVHVGETVVPGIQNQPGSVIMRVADMSVVTAELKVDESDIVNVKLGQPVSLLIDAYGDRKFPATVTEVGDTAILRSTGQAASSSSGSASQDAKDFKVVVTLNNPPADMKPGLSCTARITTATAKNAVSLPIQAVVERDPAQLEAATSGTAQAAAPSLTRPADANKKVQPVTGVFVLHHGVAEFHPVKTGVTGVDRIEVLQGVNPGDEVVTGPFRALRTMKNHSKVKIDNALVKATELTG